jgi:uncharacterized membrane protein
MPMAADVATTREFRANAARCARRRVSLREGAVMASRTSVAGHANHPMLVPLPIDLFVFSFVCDLLLLYDEGNTAWNTFALYTMGAGIVGVLLATVFGLIHLVALSPSPAKRIGIWHMVLNVTAVVAFTLSLWLRPGGMPDAATMLVSLTGVALLIISGWLGRHIVFVQRATAGSEPNPR